MSRPKKESPDLTDERNEKLLEEYYKVMASYGPTARYISKSLFYQQAAKPFFIHPDTAKCIIRRLLKMKSSEHVQS